MLVRWLTFLTPQRIRVYPIILATVVVVVGVAEAALGPAGAVWDVFGGDFRAFYTAGSFVREGHPELLYDVDAQQAFQSRVILHGTARSEVSVWLSPPVWAWAYVPLSVLRFPGALVAHTFVVLLLAWGALALLAREFGDVSARAMAFAALLYYPTLQCLIDGQTTPLALFVFTAVFVLLRRNQDIAAGAALGCLAYKPQLALGLVVMLAAARRWRAVLACFAVGMGFAALSLALLPDATRAYVRGALELGREARDSGYPVEGLHSLFQFGTLLVDDLSYAAGTWVGALLTAGGLAVLFALWWRQPWRPGAASWDRRMAATYALATLASPHLFGYDLMLLLLPTFIAWHLYPRGTRGRPLDAGPLLGVTAACYVLALAGPALTVAERAVTRWAFGHAVGLQVGVLAVLLWAWVILHQGRR